MRVTLFHLFTFLSLSILSLIPSRHFSLFLEWLDHAKCLANLSKSGAVVVLVTPSLTCKNTSFKILDSSLFLSVSLRVSVLIGPVLIRPEAVSPIDLGLKNNEAADDLQNVKNPRI
jgi:hypothetical protein